MDDPYDPYDPDVSFVGESELVPAPGQGLGQHQGQGLAAPGQGLGPGVRDSGVLLGGRGIGSDSDPYQSVNDSMIYPILSYTLQLPMHPFFFLFSQTL